MITRHPRWPGHVACAALAALAAPTAAGCGTDSGPTATTATPRPVPTATKTTPAPPKAADGTRYSACKDGNCEVAVSKPVKIRLGGRIGSGTLSIKKVLSDGVKIYLTLPGGGGDGSIKGHCTSTFHIASAGGGLSCPVKPAGPPKPDAGDFAIQLVAVTGKTAILRLATG
ncbi:MAG: hypothetical protein ACRDP6_34405 [Actinoallomurus sp.]